MSTPNEVVKRRAELFICACALVAQADGRIERSEVMATIQGMRAVGFAIDDDKVEEILAAPAESLELDLDLLDDPQDKDALMAIMLVVAQSDGDYSFEEQDLISNIQAKLGVTDSRMLEIALMVKDGGSTLAGEC